MYTACIQAILVHPCKVLNVVEATDEIDEYSYSETEEVAGWHANLLLHGEELPSELAGFVIDEPSNPVRRFA